MEMLKRRIIPIELFDSGRLYKTKQFDHRRDVGHPVASSKVYSDQDADELIFLNINRENTFDNTFLETISLIAKNAFVPLAVGGGIRKYDHAEELFRSGADKVVLNTAAYENSELISLIAKNHGTQAIIVSIDVRKSNSETYELFSNCGRQKETLRLEGHIERVAAAGAGEIMLQSIDSDGMMCGYDIKLLTHIRKMSPVPIIIAGGAGSLRDLRSAFESGADAAACGSLFNFGDNNPLRAKAFLKNYGIPLKTI